MTETTDVQTPDTFVDALAVVVFHGAVFSDCGHMCAEKVLAMPEMQAIKLALNRLSFPATNGATATDAHRKHVLRYHGLPPSVIDWVFPDDGHTVSI